MNVLKNKKGFTLVELLAVIVVLAIVMSIAVVAITNVIDSSRKAAFVLDAQQFLDGAVQLVDGDGLNNLIGGDTAAKYAPVCSNGTGSTKWIPLTAIEVRAGTGEKSPYGSKYLKGEGKDVVSSQPDTDYSFVRVTSKVDASLACTYTYEIYLTDGVYEIGKRTAPLPRDKVVNTEVKLKTNNAN